MYLPKLYLNLTKFICKWKERFKIIENKICGFLYNKCKLLQKRCQLTNKIICMWMGIYEIKFLICHLQWMCCVYFLFLFFCCIKIEVDFASAIRVFFFVYKKHESNPFFFFMNNMDRICSSKNNNLNIVSEVRNLVFDIVQTFIDNC